MQSLAKFKVHEICSKATQVSGPPSFWHMISFQPLKRASGVGRLGAGRHCDLLLALRWLPESIRWMVLSGRSSKALKTLRQVAAFNGKKEEGKKLSLEVEAEGDYGLGQEPRLCYCAIPFLLPPFPLPTSLPLMS